MKKTILRFGIYSAVTICVLFLLSWYLIGDQDYTTQEILGYASIIVSLSFVYFGIKHYRDKESEGLISLGKALGIGILITLCAALAFGILDIIYNQFINPDFLNEYYQRNIEELRSTLPPEEFQVKLETMESEKALFANPMMSFILMFMTVFVIGFIMSLISALILQKKS
ncbi:DUF4199 domain-containing protein [Poritiphilus flavus]|uniref:DUF4199 family protein n=1 Tax=Poritiphilus flavus TaxID=2697053 RepID=A0A6L9E7W2_9FLAO|nr:DUF4199 domain-containing protein [Poritiphilus flavus]NAS10663.1 DUF4199 family protein [Poritiphilus flavus]